MESVIEKISKFVTKFKTSNLYELESRLGKNVDGEFVNGVTHEYFEEIFRELEGCSELQTTETWKEEMDVFFEHDKKQYRTRVIYPSETMKVKTSTIEKKKIDSINISVNATFDCRVTLSTERNVPEYELPSIVEPTYVRLKHVKKYFMCKEGEKIWSFELKKSWSAISRTIVEEKQHTEIPVYEIECELFHNNNYLKEKNDKHISESLMMKTLDLIGYPNANYEINTTKKRKRI